MEKHSHEEAQTGRKSEEERSDREKVRIEKMQVREKVGKSRTTVFFPLFCGSGRSKSRLSGGCGDIWADKKLHAVVVRSTLGSKKC